MNPSFPSWLNLPRLGEVDDQYCSAVGGTSFWCFVSRITGLSLSTRKMQRWGRKRAQLTSSALQCQHAKGERKNSLVIGRCTWFCPRPPRYTLNLGCNKNLQGSIGTTLEVSYRHLQGSSYHDFLLKTWVIKDIFQFLDCHNLFKCQAKSSHGKITDINSVVGHWEAGGYWICEARASPYCEELAEKSLIFLQKIKKI